MLYHHASKGRASGSAASAIFALLLSVFLFQSMLVQTHMHFQAGSSFDAFASANTSAADADDETDTNGKKADDCLLCREAAASGHYVASAPALLALPTLDPHWPRIQRYLRWTMPNVAIGWQGRAPPR